MTDDTNASNALDLRPILGVIARSWQRIHPLDLTADEAFSLMNVLLDIENRIESEKDAAEPDTGRPTLRLIHDRGRP